MARRWIRRDLVYLGLPEGLLDDAEVVVSELLGNAVRHARPIGDGVLLVEWRLEESAVTVQVTDGGSSGRVQLRGDGVLDETGRGLRIVGGLARDWGVIDHPGGMRTVWATLAVEEDHGPWCLPGGDGLRLV